MFKIKTNNFTSTGIVNYIDDNGNKITVIGEKDGSAFKIKLRPNANIKIETISFESPYYIDGINFKNQPLDEDAIEYINSEEYKILLQEVVSIAELWVKIQAEKKLLVSDTYQVTDEGAIEKIEITQEITETLLEDLKQYEESKEFAILYGKLLGTNNVTNLF